MSPSNKVPAPFQTPALSEHVAETVHAAWRAAVVELIHSLPSGDSLPKYQFCRGYVQALADSEVLNEQDAAYLREMILDMHLIGPSLLRTEGN